MQKVKLKNNLNITKEDDDFLYIWGYFDEKPNKIKYHGYYPKSIFKDIEALFLDRKISRDVIPADDFDIINDKVFSKISDEIFISYTVYDTENEDSQIFDITFFYKSESNLDKINEIIQALNQESIDDEIEMTNSNLETLVLSSDGINREPIEFELDENISLFYNKNTFKKSKKLIKKINNSAKGLSIIHGERGTGKTNIIKFLSTKTEKTVIYIPNNLLDVTINSSEFSTFIKNYNNPVIVIDDCEFIFNDFYSKSNSYTSNILQMIDGLMSDMIPINFIMIFNCELEDIDTNLLESNNLLEVLEFNNLSKDEATELSKYIGNNEKIKSDTKLSVVINNKLDKKEYNKIGLE